MVETISYGPRRVPGTKAKGGARLYGRDSYNVPSMMPADEREHFHA
jgi:hypothetical protein